VRAKATTKENKQHCNRALFLAVLWELDGLWGCYFGVGVPEAIAWILSKKQRF